MGKNENSPQTSTQQQITKPQPANLGTLQKSLDPKGEKR